MIKGHRSIADLDSLHSDQHRILFQNCLGVIEKVFSVVPTADDLPVGYCGLYVSGTVSRLYFNINNTVISFAIKDYVDSEIVSANLWEIDGTETQLKTADEIDMRSKKIINVTDPTANQDAATKKYVDDTADSHVVAFGAWVDKSASYGAQVATTDGFVIVHNQWGYYGIIFTDANADPTTERARDGSNAECIMCPVRKGDYWKVTSGGGTPVSVYWLPLGV